MTVTGIIVGTGNIARRHTLAMTMAGGLCLGVVDIDHERAARFAKGSPLGERALLDPASWPRVGAVYKTATEAVREARPDVCVVSVWPGAHLDVVRELIQAGAKVILVEKPCGTTLEQATEIERLARDNGVVVAVALQHRFGQRPVRDFVVGQVGNVLSVSVKWLRRAIGDVALPIMQSGVLLDLFPHAFDIGRFLAGLGLPVAAQALLLNDRLAPVRHGEAEVWAKGVVSVGGVLLDFHVAWVHPALPVGVDEIFEITIDGDRDRVTVQAPCTLKGENSIQRPVLLASEVDGVQIERLPNIGDFYVAQMMDLFEAARNPSHQVLCPVREALAVHHGIQLVKSAAGSR